jgi:glycosyltransferase involved in cell wall biosynthesis
MIVFVQQFSFGVLGGGPRIFRSLTRSTSNAWASVYTCAHDVSEHALPQETWIRYRPSLGIFENTRFAPLIEQCVTPSKSFYPKLLQFCSERPVTVIHGLAHSLDFYDAYLVAQKLNLPFVLTVHDEFGYIIGSRRLGEIGSTYLREVWQNASLRFSICDELAQEYNRRYGEREYHVVTDGVEFAPRVPRERDGLNYRVYFAGLFNFPYCANGLALLDALGEIQQQKPEANVNAFFRSGSLPREMYRSSFTNFKVGAYIKDDELLADLTDADILYLPLPFEATYDRYVKFSLSTKLVTYLGSGLPIVYHGPRDSALANVLADYSAAVMCHSNKIEELMTALASANIRRHELVENAAKLADSKFRLGEISQRFWNPIEALTDHGAQKTKYVP